MDAENETLPERDNDSSDSDDSEDDSSYYTEYSEENLLENALFPQQSAVDTRTPLERWRDYLNAIRTRQTKVFKIVDAQLEDELSLLTTLSTNNNHNHIMIGGVM